MGWEVIHACWQPIGRNIARGKESTSHAPGALLLGSTGARLWADYLDPVPGFSGRFDFIHKVNIPLLFKITNNLAESLEPCQTEWFPSHLLMAYTGNRLSLEERKFITWNDCAVSCQTWTNRSDEELILRLETYGDSFSERIENYLYGLFNIEHYSFNVTGAIAVSDPTVFEELRLKPGETKAIIVAAAFGISAQDDIALLKERASSYAESGYTVDQLVVNQSNEYQIWFEKTPTFASSDPVLNKTWTYRWFLLRHNLADPQYGHLSYPLFYEGRSHKK